MHRPLRLNLAPLLLLLLVPPAFSQEVNLLIIGDWGANTPEQRHVAEALARYAQSTPIDALVSTGDNFYSRLTGVADPQWRTLFEDLYDPRRLNFPFYMALGNHDYDGQNQSLELAYARANPASRWKLPAPWYRVDLPAANPLVTLLILDSNKPRLRKRDWLAQLDWLTQQLASPRAPWTICIAHHPLFSNGPHGDYPILQRDWSDLLAQHHVPFYIAGHDHTLQHLQLPTHPTTFLISGAGGASLVSIVRETPNSFARSSHGFLHLRFLPTHATARFLSPDGTSLHHFDRPRSPK